MDIEELKKLMYAAHAPQTNQPTYIIQQPPQIVAPAPVPVPSPTPAPAVVPAATQPAVTVRAQRKPSTPPKVAVPVDPPTPVPVPKPEAVAPVVKAEPEPVVVPEPTKKADPAYVFPTCTINFSPKLNPELVDYFKEYRVRGGTAGGDMFISIEITTDISFDELVFEIRSAVSEKIDLSLGKIGLQLPSGQVITLGMDAKTKFTPDEASIMAADGTLTVRILKALTDAQLDALASTKQRQQTSADRARGIHKQKKPNKSYHSSARVIELLSDSSDAVDSDTPDTGRYSRHATQSAALSQGMLDNIETMMLSREALDNTALHISDKEGMTDDELIHQVRHVMISWLYKYNFYPSICFNLYVYVV